MFIRSITFSSPHTPVPLTRGPHQLHQVLGHGMEPQHGPLGQGAAGQLRGPHLPKSHSDGEIGRAAFWILRQSQTLVARLPLIRFWMRFNFAVYIAGCVSLIPALNNMFALTSVNKSGFVFHWVLM